MPRGMFRRPVLQTRHGMLTEAARHKVLLLCLTYLCVASFVTILFGSGLLRYQRYRRLGVETRGTIIETRCGHHQTFLYEYTVRGRTYRATGSAGFGNPECYDLKPGDPVRIWYLPDNEMASEAGDPEQRQRNEALGMVVGPIWFALPFAFLIGREIRRSKASSTMPPPSG
jgi:hypothetical protein